MSFNLCLPGTFVVIAVSPFMGLKCTKVVAFTKQNPHLTVKCTVDIESQQAWILYIQDAYCTVADIITDTLLVGHVRNVTSTFGCQPYP